MFIPPKSDELHTESDVEQKVAWPLLIALPPHGFGFPESEIFTKPNIRDFKIGKGSSAKLYYPDYIVTVSGLPVLLVEVKKPGEDLQQAALECRLYATELNASYPTAINPCRFCIVTDGLTTQLRHWDSDDAIAEFSLTDIGPVAPSFGGFARHISSGILREHAAQIHSKQRPDRFARALSLVGGQTAQSEQIAYNNFGRVLAANFQAIFDPASYEDRRKIVTNAYVGSPRKHRYVGEIDRIIRNASPAISAEIPLVEDPANPTVVTQRFQDLPSLRNKVLLLVGAVGVGKSTFIDYLQEQGLPAEVREHTAWLRIDLNPAPVTSGEIYTWVRRQIIDGIRATSPDIDTATLDNLRKLYRQRVREFEQGEGSLFDKGSPEYNSRFADLLRQLKQDEILTIQCLEQFLCTGRSRLLVIALDNCDKRDRDQQLLMFQVAKYIQQEIRCLVILPLRHQTFENHRHEPPLDTALKDLVYRIEPPPCQEVLKLRLGLVVHEARRLGPKVLAYQIGGSTVEFPTEKLERFLHAMMGALFDHKQYGRKIIIGLAGWNIRKAFEIFLEFCRSGFITEQDIFGIQAKSDAPVGLPQSTVARVLLRTNRRYYDGNLSFVKNLFQCDPASIRPCAFHRYWILAWLRSKSVVCGPNGEKGFHRQGDLVRTLLSIGVDPDAVRRECRYLSAAGCIVAEHLRSDQIADTDLVSITPAGHVHLELAYNDLHYLAACAEDCWVADANLAEEVRARITIQPYYYALSWNNTLSNAHAICEYLRWVQDKETQTANFLSAFEGQPPVIYFDALLSRIEMQIQRNADRYSPKN